MARHIQRRLISSDAHPLDVRRKHAHLLLQRQRTVDRGEDMATAGVVLERHAGDMKILPERRERPLPVRPITLTHGAPVARITFQHI